MKKTRAQLTGNLKRCLATALSVFLIVGMTPVSQTNVFAESTDSIVVDEAPMENDTEFSEETDSENNFDTEAAESYEDIEEDSVNEQEDESGNAVENDESEENSDEQGVDSSIEDNDTSTENDQHSESSEDDKSFEVNTSEETEMTEESATSDSDESEDDEDDSTSFNPTVVLSKTSFVYNGKKQQPDVIVMNGDEEVSKDKYSVFYDEKDSINVGTYDVAVYVENDFGWWDFDLSYKITPKTITPSVTLSKTTFTYSGKVQKPTITVKDNKTTIPESNFTATYSSSPKDAGTYKITVKLKGNYSGTATASYKITPKKVTPSVTLSKKEYFFNGKVQKPSVTVKADETKLAAKNYTVTYDKGLKNVGTYKVTVKLKGNYSGSKAVSYKISPKPTSITSAVGTDNKISVKWKKQATQITGYQIQYSQKKDFKSGNKTVTIAKPGIVSKEISKPVKGKNYFVRIRTYKKVGAKTYYSSWSKVAYTAIKQKIKGETTASLCSWGNSKQVSFTFTTANRMMFIIPIKATAEGKITKGGIRVILEDSAGKKLQNDLINMKGYEYGEYYETWLYDDALFVGPGTYTYTIKNTSDNYIDVKYSVLSYLKIADSASVKDSVNAKSGQWVKIGKIGEGCPLGDISLSDKSVLTYYDIEVNGTLWVYADKIGSSNATIKLENGKKYSCKITVSPGNPNFFAITTGYYTRDNYFEVKVKNLRSSNLTIVRKGAKVINYDYKEYDRNIKSGDNIVVKPGETKYIRFYIKGSYTWYDYKDFDLHAKIIFEGVTYEWHVWRNDSCFKNNGSWWNTYWDESAFADWI